MPAGWAPCQLGEILELKYGKALLATSRDGGAYPVYGSNGIVGNHSAYLAEGPTVIVGRKGSVGEVCYSAVPCSPIDTTYYADEFEVTNSKFIYYLLRNLDLASLNKSTAIPGLNRQDAYDLEIPLAPLAEQKRIAQKLDALLAQVDTLKARIDAIPVLLKRFRRATLAAAANGVLTQDWRGTGSTSNLESADEYLTRILEERQASPRTKFKPPIAPDTETRTPKVPGSWVVSSVAAFAECLDSMRVPVKKELRAREGGTYPYFGANGEVDRVDEFIFDDDLVLVTEDETFYGRAKPIAYMYSGKCWVNNHVHALRAHDRVGQSFLCYILMHYDVVPWLTGTTGRAKLTQGALMALPIGVPPPAEQTEIVRRVEQLFAYADLLEAKVAAAQQRIDALTQSLLAKAFRGELVPQDPTDEPASVLLERIRAQRAAAPKPKRGRKAATS
ncbi:type I restriction endonuclease subunit S [Xanthomonas oryzae]|nr:type I restriction endonuclease subunit S [Xanthomonas oryzae]